MSTIASQFRDAAQTYQAVRRRMAIALRDFGAADLTPERAMILIQLKAGPQTVGQLHDTAYHGSNISYNLKQLCDDGYAETFSNPCDGRLRMVRLLPKGDDVVERLATVSADGARTDDVR